jgi:3-oxoacyl-[acyl-carrier protein] reductase
VAHCADDASVVLGLRSLRPTVEIWRARYPGQAIRVGPDGIAARDSRRSHRRDCALAFSFPICCGSWRLLSRHDQTGEKFHMRLKDKIAIITGAGGGFGEGIARRFAAEGARVAIVDLRAEAAERVASEIGEQAIAITADVGVGADVARVLAETIKRFGTPDILINNAGVTHKNGPILDVTEEMFDRIFRVNVKSIFYFVREIAPLMRDNGGGVILNIGSTAGLRPRPGLTWYNASKGAVNLVSKSLAVELAPWKIRVNSICPVMGETGLLEAFMGVPDTAENRAKFVATIPLGRMSRPADIANAALYLASDEADFITGVEFPVDGGRTI